jgi:hypothetical protein
MHKGTALCFRNVFHWATSCSCARPEADNGGGGGGGAGRTLGNRRGYQFNQATGARHRVRGPKGVRESEMEPFLGHLRGCECQLGLDDLVKIGSNF